MQTGTPDGKEGAGDKGGEKVSATVKEGRKGDIPLVPEWWVKQQDSKTR